MEWWLIHLNSFRKLNITDLILQLSVCLSFAIVSVNEGIFVGMFICHFVEDLSDGRPLKGNITTTMGVTRG